MAWFCCILPGCGHVLSRLLTATSAYRRMAAVFLLGMAIGYPAPLTAEGREAQKGGKPMALTITSQAFSQNGSIPGRYTCDGEDTSPPLEWSGLPQGARSLVLIVDDPDAPDPKAPKMTWVHWVLYNIPPSATGLVEGIKAKSLPEGTKEGLNDWKRTGYGGPCPPVGRHRYFHKLYALDIVLDDLGKPTKAQLEKAMAGHVIEQSELVGTYQHSR